MKKLILTFLSITLAYAIQAQAPNYTWAKKAGSASNYTSARSVATDASGNVYTIGNFEGTVDFNPGTGVSNLTSAGQQDIFIVKLDAAGNFVWADRIGGAGDDRGFGITIDPSGNVCATGLFEGTVDFNPGAGTSNLTSIGGVGDVFILKLTAAGVFTWAKKVGGQYEDYGYAIDTDASGNVYTTGTFIDLVDFDPGTGTANITSNSSGTEDIFILKLDASGNYVWAKRMGSLGTETPYSLVLDAAGNIYTCGTYDMDADFDPSPSVSYTLAATANFQNAFISKLDASGNFVWAKALLGNENAACFAVDVDASGNVYTTGNFSGTLDFNPGTGTSYLTSVGNDGSTDVFVLKLNSAGNYQWVKRMWGAGYDVGYDVKLDNYGNIYATGYFSATTDFDSGSGVFDLTPTSSSNNNSDMFLLKMNPAGNFLWAGKVSGVGNENPSEMVITSASDAVYLVGTFDDVTDFDPSSSTANVTPIGTIDAFVMKMCLPAADPVAIVGSTTVVSGGTATYSISAVSGATGYVWTVPTGATINSGQGTTSINITFGTTSGSVAVTATNSCGSSQRISQFVTIAGTCLATINISTANTTICSGSAVFSSTVTNGGTTPSYQWKKNGGNVGSNISTYSPSTLVNGDVISCVLTSTLSCASPSVITSNTIAMTVSSSVAPSITISTPNAAICGSSAVFSSTVANGGSAPAYQWKKNGTNVGSNIPTYSPTSLVNSDKISCVLTSNASCATTSVATSNTITMTVGTTTIAPTIVISTPNTSICGSSAVFSSTITNGGTAPTYRWKKNGGNVGSNIPTYSPTSLLNGDVISCILTSNLSCASSTAVASNSITMVVSSLVPTIDISTSTPTICGTSAVFTSTITNGGSTPAYQWTKNGGNVGSNISTYSPTSLVNGDVITCALSSNASCASPSTAVSNAITMVVSVCSGIKEVNEGKIQASVYPNPVSGVLYVEVLNLDKYHVELRDELGRVMFSGDDTKYIETTDYTNGIYYLTITSLYGNAVRKIIITN